MLLYTKFAQPKTAKKRSRGGCTHCKEKKKKCDEERPQCSRCAERGAECVYEAVKPRQRRKRDSILSEVPPTLRLAAQQSGRPLPDDAGPDSDDSNDESRLDWAAGDDAQQYDEHAYFSATDPFSALSPGDGSFDTASLVNFLTPHFAMPSPIGSLSFDLFQPSDEHETQPHQDDEESRRGSVAGAVVSASRAHFPDLAMIAPCPVVSPLLDFCPPAFSEFSERPNRRALVDHFCNVLSHLIVFREESGNPFQQLVLPLTSVSLPVTNAIFALASAHLEYRSIENEEKSAFFHNQAIQGLAKMIEHGGKPDRNEVLATIMLLVYYEVLVQKGRSNIVEGHLKGALTIMSADAGQPDPTGVFLERAFSFYDVIAALSNGTAPLSTAPATGCLLPLSPLGAPVASPLSNVDTLLGMATTLWPIIHRLSSLLSLKTELESAVASNAASSKIAVLRTEFESTSKAIRTALTHWRPNLPPNFVPDDGDMTELTTVVDVTDDSFDGIGNGPAGAPASLRDPGSSGAERGHLNSILHNALAYKHSAFVYLYRAIYSWPRSHELVRHHAHQSLTHCVATVSSAGPMSALLWPLFVAACEATDLSDRERAGKAFMAVKKRQGMMNIERAWEIVKEVWRRADLAEMLEKVELGDSGTEDDPVAHSMATASSAKDRRARPGFYERQGPGADLWRQVSRDMGVSVVFG